MGLEAKPRTKLQQMPRNQINLIFLQKQCSKPCCISACTQHSQSVVHFHYQRNDHYSGTSCCCRRDSHIEWGGSSSTSSCWLPSRHPRNCSQGATRRRESLRWHAALLQEGARERVVGPLGLESCFGNTPHGMWVLSPRPLKLMESWFLVPSPPPPFFFVGCLCLETVVAGP